MSKKIGKPRINKTSVSAPLISFTERSGFGLVGSVERSRFVRSIGRAPDKHTPPTLEPVYRPARSVGLAVTRSSHSLRINPVTA